MVSRPGGSAHGGARENERMTDAPATPTPPGSPASLPSDDELMGLALAEALAAAEREPADVPIGAVVLGADG